MRLSPLPPRCSTVSTTRNMTTRFFVAYTRRIIEHMGGRGAGLDPCAREIYREWAACHHFEL